MKKAILLGVLAVFLSTGVANATLDISLKYGMSGQPVMELQDLLVSEGCLSVSPTGYFGLLTLQGVKCFQSKHGIEATGYFGILSRTKANTLVSSAISDSNDAETAETGSITALVSCKSGDLFDANTGKPCSETTKEIQKITEKIDALSTKVDAISTSSNPFIGSVPTVEKVPYTVRVNGGARYNNEDEFIGFAIQFSDYKTGDTFSAKVKDKNGNEIPSSKVGNEDFGEDSVNDICHESGAKERCSTMLYYSLIATNQILPVEITINGETKTSYIKIHPSDSDNGVAWLVHLGSSGVVFNLEY